MQAGLDPFTFLIVTIADWMNQRQQQVIEYLMEENRVLREQIGNRRMGFTDNRRCRLAVKAKRLNRKVLAQVATIVTPETLSVTSSLIPQLPTFSNAMASSQYRGETVKRLGKSFSLDIGIRLLRRISSPWRCGLVRD